MTEYYESMHRKKTASPASVMIHDEFEAIRREFGGITLMLREDIEDFTCSLVAIPAMDCDSKRGCAIVHYFRSETEFGVFEFANELCTLGDDFSKLGFAVPSHKMIERQIERQSDSQIDLEKDQAGYELLWSAWNAEASKDLTATAKFLLESHIERLPEGNFGIGFGCHFSAAVAVMLSSIREEQESDSCGPGAVEEMTEGEILEDDWQSG